MFSNASSSSISFATETPSFVILGPPNFLSITTFLPLGPNVTLTALARASTPFFNASPSFTFPCSACAPRGVLGGAGIYAGGGGGGGGSDNRTGGTGGGGNPAPGSCAANRPGKANTAGGGAGGSTTPYVGGAGGSGLVIVGEKCQQPCGSKAPGIWSMNTVYEYVKDDNWV